MQLPMFSPTSAWRPPRVSDLPSWAGAKRVGVDIETCDPDLKELGPGPRRKNAFIAGVSFAIEDGPRFYLPLRHEGGDNVENPEQALVYLRDNAREFTEEIGGQNLQYDLDFLSTQENIRFDRVRAIRDTMIADPLINELHRSYSLDAIAARRQLPGKDEELLREAARHFGVDPKSGLWRLPARFVAPYAEHDAQLPLLVLRRQERDIEEQDLWEVWNIESQLLPVLLKMRQRGVRVSEERLSKVEEWSLQQEAEALAKIRHITGVSINVGDVMKATVIGPALEHVGVKLQWGETKTGKPTVSIDKDLLAGVAAGAEKGSAAHTVATQLSWARKTNKLRTTFARSVRSHMTNGRIHTSFNQLRKTDDDGDEGGAAYGRLSCEAPNMQQQPARDEFAKMWRSIYLPEEGGEWGALDYCFHPSTEVLTDEGWKPLPTLSGREQLAQWRGGEISFAKPLSYQRIEFDGDLVHVRGDRQAELLMTPNHNCLLIGADGKERWLKAEQYEEVEAFQLHAGLRKSGTPTDFAILRLAVMVQADASIRSESYRLWFKKPRKIERARQLLQAAGIEWREYECEKKAAGHAVVFKRDWRIEAFVDDQKMFQRDALLALDGASRDVFLDELEHWDGTSARHTYCSGNLHNVEVVQEIAVLTNRRANLGQLARGWFVTLTRRTRTWAGKFRTNRLPYKGPVYCVTMPQSTVVTRLNGRVSITGQSQQEPRMLIHYAEVCNLTGAYAAAQRYRDDPSTDNHQMMSDMTGVPRKQAKELFLGKVYGMGGAKLCRKLGLPTRWCVSSRGLRIRNFYATRAEALEFSRSLGVQAADHRVWVGEVAGEAGQAIIDQFDSRLPFVKQLSNKCKAAAEEKGFIRTIGGRRCRFPQREDGTYDWTHKALNRLIQGGSACQTKKAVVMMGQAGYFIQLQVHDEVDGSFGSRREARDVAEIMSTCYKMQVPFKVDIEMGPSWGEAVAIEEAT